MKAVHKISGFLYSFAIILILFVTAFDIACYSDFGFYEKEYEKYQVLDDLHMEMDDVMEVTRHMMDYLRGREESMQINTTVDGQSRDFFNEQDLFHMAEVKDLFLGMFHLRTGAFVVLILSLGILFAAKADGRTLFRCFQTSLGIFFGLAAALGIIVAVNFSRAFVIFHHLFFDNDLWLFDPATDLMINMLPEGLFMDFTIRILSLFVLLLAAFEAAFLLARFLYRRKSSPKAAGKTAALLLAFCLCALNFAEPVMAAERSSCAVQSIAIPGDDLTSLPDWPAGPEVQADAAILIDARTGNILYGKNIDTPYPPASITKILTALIACEQSSLSDTVEYSHYAVYSIPWDGSTVGFSEDEAVSMKDSLYGMLLKSGNEAAAGIAEHIGGSIEGFASMMNERARQAGATNSNFVNPHGLHDDNHYTTCHDMAMIMRDAVHNDTFLEIASTYSYEIGPTNINPDGYRFTAGHRMLSKNRDEYYEYAIAGKTGYTSKAGNTLVTYAKNGDMELICVILHSIQTQYSDTRALFDYGFSSFTCYNAAAEDTSYTNEGVGFFSFLSSAFENTPVSVELGDSYIVLPATVPFSSLTSRLDYSNIPSDENGENSADANILGYVHYEYQGIEVGQAPLRLISRVSEGFDFTAHNQTSENSGNDTSFTGSDGIPPETSPQTPDSSKRVVTINVWHLFGYIFLAVLFFLVLGLLIRYYSPKQRRVRKARQMRRIYMSGEKKKRKKKRELR